MRHLRFLSLPLHILAAFALGLLAYPFYASAVDYIPDIDPTVKGRIFWRLIGWQETCFRRWVVCFVPVPWSLRHEGITQQELDALTDGEAYEYCNHMSEMLGQGI